MANCKYKRVMLKLSGEALAGENGFGLDFTVATKIANEIKKIVDLGVEVGAVEVANNRVNQAYFIGNEPLKQNHKDFLKKWCVKYGVEPNHQITTE